MLWLSIPGVWPRPHNRASGIREHGSNETRPTAKGVAGVDVYAGCKIDYSGNKVTPDTFLRVSVTKRR